MPCSPGISSANKSVVYRVFRTPVLLDKLRVRVYKGVAESNYYLRKRKEATSGENYKGTAEDQARAGS